MNILGLGLDFGVKPMTVVKATVTVSSINLFFNDDDEDQQSKLGPYDNSENGCSKCGRHRVVLGDDSKHRCEKCGWCEEDEAIDVDFIQYIR